MIKLPKRLPYEFLLLAALAVSSCDGPGLTEKQRDEVSDIANAEVGDSEAVVSLRDRVQAIEDKLNM
jgi:hypothetical protein